MIYGTLTRSIRAMESYDVRSRAERVLHHYYGVTPPNWFNDGIFEGFDAVNCECSTNVLKTRFSWPLNLLMCMCQCFFSTKKTLFRLFDLCHHRMTLSYGGLANRHRSVL